MIIIKTHNLMYISRYICGIAAYEIYTLYYTKYIVKSECNNVDEIEEHG